MVVKSKPVCISLMIEQKAFIDNEGRTFSLSKFVQAKLGEYIKMLKEYREFTTND